MFFFNSNTRALRKALRERDKHKWLFTDAFGRNPYPPPEVCYIPAVLCEGVWYVDLYTAYFIDKEGKEKQWEVFAGKVVAALTSPSSNLVRGYIKKVRSNFVRIELHLPNVHQEPFSMQVHTRNLALVNAE